MPKKILLLCIAMLFTATAWCDTVLLKNGNKITGQIIHQDKNKVVVKMAFGKIVIATKQIRKIKKEGMASTVIAQSNRLISLGADRQGIIYLKRAIRKYPKNKKLKRGLADLYFQLGKRYILYNPKKALGFLQKAKKINSNFDITPYRVQIEDRQKLSLDTKIQGDTLLQKQDYQKALKIYKEALEVNPDLYGEISKSMSICASQLGHQNFRNKKYSAALNFYTMALKQDPKVFPYIEQPWLYSKTEIIASEYLKANNWQGALTELQTILEVRPDYRRALLMTGFSLEKLKDYPRAFKYYQEITGGNQQWNGQFALLERIRTTAELRVRNSADLKPFFVPKDARTSKEWRKMETLHFSIYYQNKDLAKKIANTFEFQWNSIRQKLGSSNERKWTKCEVYIFPSRQEYMKNTGLPEWSDGVTKMAFQQGRLYQHKIYLYASAPLLLSNIIPHELTHAMYPWFLNYQRQLPTWLNEGVAMTSEAQFRSSNRHFTLKRAIKRGTLFPLPKLFNASQYPESEDQVNVFYAQSLSVVSYLIKRKGVKGLLEFSKKINNLERALQDVYGISSISKLERQWLNYAKGS